jgi:hypothetical protein
MVNGRAHFADFVAEPMTQRRCQITLPALLNRFQNLVLDIPVDMFQARPQFVKFLGGSLHYR